MDQYPHEIPWYLSDRDKAVLRHENYQHQHLIICTANSVPYLEEELRRARKRIKKLECIIAKSTQLPEKTLDGTQVNTLAKSSEAEAVNPSGVTKVTIDSDSIKRIWTSPNELRQWH